jgi:hypothetical protein
MWEKDVITDLYNELFIRKSIRQYEPTELDGATVDSINAAAKCAFPLMETPAVFRVLSREQVEKPFGKAPHYLVVYAKDDDPSAIHASFMLQQMSLWLSVQGLGSCWVGAGKPKAEFAVVDNLHVRGFLAFGKPAEELHRSGVKEFKRKALPEMTDTTGMDSLLEPVRIAPSAINRQGWYITGDAAKLRLFMADNGFLVKKLFDPLTLMDAGIALSHLWIAAAHDNRFASFEQEPGNITGPKTYHYAWTINL